MLRLDDERALVLTTDFFTPIVDDPEDWGRIAAANALSDVYAMGGRPLFAVNLAAWPGDGLDIALLGQVLRGGAQVAAQAGCFVAGGHTIDDPVPKYGLAVVGLADPGRLMTIDRAAPGDQLILTKADRHRRDRHRAEARRARPRRRGRRRGLDDPAQRGRQPGRAGRGRAGGHRRDRVRPAGPPAPDAGRQRRRGADQRHRGPAAARRGRTGRGRLRLRRHPGQHRPDKPPATSLDPAISEELAVLLFDAQTSGGLLLAAPPGALPALLDDLLARGLPAARIGDIVAGEAGHVDVHHGPFG